MSIRGAPETGVALLHVLLLMAFVTAAAGGAALLGRVEVLVSAFHRSERGAAYAAEAMLAAALHDLDRAADWDAVLAGQAQAGFVDGPVTSDKWIPGGGRLSVCCAPGSMTAHARVESGTNWTPYAWQSLSALLGIGDAPKLYLAAWVADDGEDGDGDEATDANQRLLVRAEAATPFGVRRTVEALVERAPIDPATGASPPGVKVLTWHEVR